MSLLEAARYSGVISSHSWSTPDVIPRIYKLGGVVAPYAGDTTSFVKAWKEIKPKRDKRFYFGFGYGADMNGFGAQGGPRTGAKNPVRYPFKSFDGGTTLSRQRSGQRLFDINVDGVAHYGLYPDWLEDLRMIAGDQIIKDMSRGAETYLQMWERAVGIPRQCRRARMHFTRRGLGSSKLGQKPSEVLSRTGQPTSRTRTWRYCVKGLGNGHSKVVVVFTPGDRVGFIASSGLRHEGVDVTRGDSAGNVRRIARSLGHGLWLERGGGGSRFVFGVRRGRVRFVALASRQVAGKDSRLRKYVKRAKLR
jgi:hypothetical protein